MLNHAHAIIVHTRGAGIIRGRGLIYSAQCQNNSRAGRIQGNAVLHALFRMIQIEVPAESVIGCRR